MKNVNRSCKQGAGNASAADQQHLRESEGDGVSDGEQRGLGAHRGKSPGGAPVEPQLRRAASADDLEIAPQNFLGMAGPKRLHAGLFCRKSPRKMNGGRAAPAAVGDFGLGEKAADKAFAVSFDQRSDAWNLGGGEAWANDVRHVKPSSA